MTDAEAHAILRDAAGKLELSNKFFFMVIREGDHFRAFCSEKDLPNVQNLTHAELTIDDYVIHFNFGGVSSHAI